MAEQQRNKKEESKSTRSKATAKKEGIPWLGMVLAVLSLAFGILTPPLLAAPKIDDTNGIISKDAPTRQLEQGTTRSKELCREQDLQEFWHDEMVPGFHILCIHQLQGTLGVTFYKYGMKSKKTSFELPLSVDWPTLRDEIAGHLSLPPVSEKKQPWALFSAQGHRLVNEDSQETAKGDYPTILYQEFGMVLLFEGGQFLWPGVRVGFRRQVDLYSVMPGKSQDFSDLNRTVTLETLSLIPLVVSVEGFLSQEECKYIQERAEPTMEYSEVVLMDKDAGRPASDFRTSQTTFLHARDDAKLIDLDYRTASLVRIERSHQEHTQVLRYGLGEKYDSHLDYFDPELYQNDAGTLQFIQQGRRNRMATVFWYLSDVEEGGETVFPRFNRSVEKSPTDCETGLKVKPQMGKVIIFYSLTADGRGDSNSLHGACPVHRGTKWAANKWVWNEPMPYIAE